MTVFVEEEAKNGEDDPEEIEDRGDASSSSISSHSSIASSLACTPSAFSGIEVSEFLPNPAGDDAAGEWIELINQTEQDAELCGWSVDDAEEWSAAFPLEELSIGAHGFLLLPRAQTKIALNNNDDAAALFAPAASGGTILIAEVPYGKVKEGESYALTGSGTYEWTAEPTPGYANVLLRENKEEIKSTKSKISLKLEENKEQKNYTDSKVQSKTEPIAASSWLQIKYKNVAPWMEEEEEGEEIPESHRYLAQSLASAQSAAALPYSSGEQKGEKELMFVLLSNGIGALLFLVKKGIIDKI
jgi:hypothetical protein